jgi:uncharacterized protein with PIN domain
MTLIRFHGELNDLIPRPMRHRAFGFRSAEHATLKHAIEAFGVPHTEVGRVLVDGVDLALVDAVGADDAIEVFPALPQAPDVRGDAEAPTFLADAHLGGLARRLRLLGFDTLLADDAPDRLLAALAGGDGRILLSRDRELLEHRRVTRGRYVRASRTDEQLREVVRHFGLWPLVRPFSRCLECNAQLRAAHRSEVLDRLPPVVAAAHEAFTLCCGCGRVYWPGSHWRRLSAVVDSVMAEAPR